MLFLDDDGKRHGIACCIGDVGVRTAKDCIYMLQRYKDRNDRLDILSLDHDLGGTVFQSSDSPECGMEVVRYLETHRCRIGQVIVHSLNWTAAIEMVKRLRAAGYSTVYRPFGRPDDAERDALVDAICEGYEPPDGAVLLM